MIRTQATHGQVSERRTPGTPPCSTTSPPLRSRPSTRPADPGSRREIGPHEGDQESKNTTSLETLGRAAARLRGRASTSRPLPLGTLARASPQRSGARLPVEFQDQKAPHSAWASNFYLPCCPCHAPRHAKPCRPLRSAEPPPSQAPGSAPRDVGFAGPTPGTSLREPESPSARPKASHRPRCPIARGLPETQRSWASLAPRHAGATEQPSTGKSP